MLFARVRHLHCPHKGKLKALPRVCERRSIVSRINEIFIAEEDGDDLVSVIVKPLPHSGQVGLQCTGVQLVAAGVAEIHLILIVMCLALDCG